MRRQERDRRGGSGLFLILALCTLTILVLLFYHQSRMTSWLSAETDVLVRAEKAELLADAAVEEAMDQIRKQANDSASPLYKSFRALVYHPEKGKLDLTSQVTFHELRQLLLEKDYRGYSLDDFKVEVVVQRQLDATAYERDGIIRYRAATSAPGGLGRSTVRRVEVVQSFRIVLTGIPQPFGAYGFFLADMGLLTDLGKVNQTRSRMIASLHRIWERLSEAKRLAPSDLAGTYSTLAGNLVAKEAADRAAPVTPADEAAFYGLIFDGLEMDLGGMDLARDLSDMAGKLAPAEAKAQAAYRRILRDGSDRDAHDAFVASAREAGGIIEEALFAIWAFRRVYRILPRSEKGYASLAKSFWKLKAAYWRRRAQFVVAPRQGETIDEAWLRFLGNHPMPRGVIWIANEQKPFRLTGRIKGQVVLVTGPGGVTLEDFNKDETAEDLVTIVSRGGTVRLRGEVHASIILVENEANVPRRLSIANDARIVGNLIAYELPATATLAGTLVRAEKYLSGRTTPKGRVYLDEAKMFVGISPMILYRKVDRS